MDQNYYSVQKSAEFLNVSEATIRNWVKLGVLDSNGTRPLKISKQAILTTKENIQNGTIDKLKKRANKLNSIKRNVPKNNEKSLITGILSNNGHNEIHKTYNINELMLKYATSFLTYKRNIDFTKVLRSNSSNYIVTNRKDHLLLDELFDWKNSLNLIDYECLDVNFNKIDIENTDILGNIYQYLLSEGRKGKTGSYYTPESVSLEMVRQNVKYKSKTLDPCCGTGSFLLQVVDFLIELGVDCPLEYVYGIEKDNIAYRIARLNLILKSDEKNVVPPNIFWGNALIDIQKILKESLFFDFVISNPPWGSQLLKKDVFELEKKYPCISSKESFSYFILSGLKLLNEGGKLCYLLPESILNVTMHSDIRSILINNTKIVEIRNLGRIFDNVFTPVIQLTIEKTNKNKNNKIHIQNGTLYRSISQDELKLSDNIIININKSYSDEHVIKTLDKFRHKYLKGNVHWALGIVTGNNSKYISDRQVSGYEPILKGKDIKKYIYGSFSSYIKYSPENFQQCASEKLYRAEEKIIYRFINKNLIFSYDNQKILTLNSANIIVPKTNFLPLKYVLAFLNSTIAQIYYEKQFNSFKILKKHLESLPIPIIEISDQDQIISIVDSIIASTSVHDKIELHKEIDHIFTLKLNLKKDKIEKYRYSNVKNNLF